MRSISGGGLDAPGAREGNAMKSVHTWLPQDAPGARGGNGTMRSISGGGMGAPGAREEGPPC